MHLFSNTGSNSERIQRKRNNGHLRKRTGKGGGGWGRRGAHRWEACPFYSFLYLPVEFCVLSMH